MTQDPHRHPDWLVPQWPAPPGVHALFTTRAGGVSPPPWGAGPARVGGMNLGLGSGDQPGRVLANRARLALALPGQPAWLTQVHGAVVVDADAAHDATPTADASTARAAGVVCAVLVADCLPVLLADAQGRGVAAAHAGWRGLAAGVLQATVTRLRQRLDDPAAEVVAWIGPAIGPARFEVGAEVREAMHAQLPQAGCAFVATGAPGKFLADLPQLARQALAQAGVTQVTGGQWCTASDADRFFSYRRDGQTGRHAALVWRMPC